MVYVNYKYYTDTYKGALPKDSFDSLVLKASKEIDKNVNTRLTKTKINSLSSEAQEQLEYVACALIDLINKNDNKKTVSSISIDGVSKTFKNYSQGEYKREKKAILDGLPIELTRYL